ncbi:ABC transporter permease [Allorhizobium sonneratiae]|uniref:ABC transporter permease n=1 Tax=Allorhizobium sonneratiae TaxID=2934936 RepID=UPI0020348DCD|nr:capsular biosynthesis protein [Allorhizobium sonneratiae]
MMAVILRDMRTRFFDHGIGYLVVALWPLTHMLALLVINGLRHGQAPYGDSMYIFLATGLIPTLLFMYVSRFMSLSIILNKPMLAFPQVQILDILMGRAVLEVVAALLTLFFFVIILLVLGENPWPYNPVQALEAYSASVLLAVGVGIVAGVITAILPIFATAYALFMILIYLSSGMLFDTSKLPDQVTKILAWLPVFQTVEWMRVAYFPTYSDKLLDRQYVLMWGLCSLFFGLVLERMVRRLALES